MRVCVVTYVNVNVIVDNLLAMHAWLTVQMLW